MIRQRWLVELVYCSNNNYGRSIELELCFSPVSVWFTILGDFNVVDWSFMTRRLISTHFTVVFFAAFFRCLVVSDYSSLINRSHSEACVYLKYYIRRECGVRAFFNDHKPHKYFNCFSCAPLFFSIISESTIWDASIRWICECKSKQPSSLYTHNRRRMSTTLQKLSIYDYC